MHLCITHGHNSGVKAWGENRIGVEGVNGERKRDSCNTFDDKETFIKEDNLLK